MVVTRAALVAIPAAMNHLALTIKRKLKKAATERRSPKAREWLMPSLEGALLHPRAPRQTPQRCTEHTSQHEKD